MEPPVDDIERYKVLDLVMQKSLEQFCIRNPACFSSILFKKLIYLNFISCLFSIFAPLTSGSPRHGVQPMVKI